MITNGDVDQFEEWTTNEYCERVPGSRPALAPQSSAVVSGPAPVQGVRSMSLRSFLSRVLFGEDVLLAQLKLVNDKLDQLLAKGNPNMADITQALQDIQTAVAQAATVEASAVTLIQSIAAQLQANSTDPATIEALAQQLTNATTPLSQAITQNTAAANLGTSPGTTTPSGSGDTGTPPPPPPPPPSGGDTTGTTTGGDTTGGTTASGGDTSPPATDPTTTTGDQTPTA